MKTRLKTRDLEWAILNSCIMGYRSGLWNIPALGHGTVQEKCDWINIHNTSRKIFRPTDWQNARRPERQKNMLPKYALQRKLRELQADASESTPSLLKESSSHILTNHHNQMDGLALLHQISTAAVQLVFFDPEYREVLDHLAYGDEGKRQRKRAELPQMDGDTIRQFFSENDRILKPSAYVMVWVDKYLLSTAMYKQWYESTSLQQVDLLTWNKARLGMGWRTRSQTEFLIILQKTPTMADATWHDHALPDIWTEKAKGHPHAKPIGLQKRLIQAVTKVGDVVCDPAAGGYSVLRCCKETGRVFIGCDLI